MEGYTIDIATPFFLEAGLGEIEGERESIYQHYDHDKARPLPTVALLLLRALHEKMAINRSLLYQRAIKYL